MVYQTKYKQPEQFNIVSNPIMQLEGFNIEYLTQHKQPERLNMAYLTNNLHHAFNVNNITELYAPSHPHIHPCQLPNLSPHAQPSTHV